MKNRLSLALIVLLGGTFIAPVTALADQKKIDRTKQQYEKKLSQLRVKYLQKMKPEQLARKKTEQIDKEAKAFERMVTTLGNAGGAAVATDLEKHRETLFTEIHEAHRKAGITAAQQRIDKMLTPAKLKRVTQGGDRARTRAQEDFDKEVGLMAELGAPQAAIDAAKKKRSEAFGAKLAADAASDQERVRKRVDKEVPTVKPLLGAPKIKAMAPTWCDGVVEAKGDKFWKSYIPDAPPNLEESHFSFNAVRTAVLFSCQDPSFDVRQAWLAAFRQQLSNRFLLSEAHNEQVMKLGLAMVKDKAWEKNNAAQLCTKHAPLSSGTREAKASRALERVALRCGNRLSRENSHRLWDLDLAGGFKSQLARAGFIDTYVYELRGNVKDYSQGALNGTTAFVVANAVPLDAKQFEQELAKLKLSPYGVAQARMTFYGALSRMKLYRQELKAASAKNPGLKKMVFDGPAASLKRFAKENAASKKVLDKVLAVEDRLDGENAINGCGKELFKEFKGYVKAAMKKQAKATPAEVRFSDMQGFLLTYGLTACGLKDETAPVLDYAMGALYGSLSPIKGPMTAAYRGMLEGYNAGLAGQKKGSFSTARSGGSGAPALKPPGMNPIKVPDLPSSTHGGMGFGSLRSLESAVVKSVKKKGDDLTVKFGTVSWKQPTYKCTETNKIDRIGSDGSIIYRSNCKKTGMRSVSFTHEPITVPSWAAAGIKKGALLKFVRYPNGIKEKRAWVVEAFASKNSKKRTGFMGAGL